MGRYKRRNQGEFSCDYCDKQTDQIKVLEKHYLIKHKDLLYMKDIYKIYNKFVLANLPYIFQIKITPKQYFACNICLEPTITQFSHQIMDHLALQHKSDEKGMDIYIKLGNLIQLDIPKETISVELASKPNFVFGCALCPHKVLFTPEEATTHVKQTHGEADAFMMLISKYRIYDLQKSNQNGIMLMKCICEIALFNSRIANHPAIASLIQEDFRKRNLTTPDSVECALMIMFKNTPSVHTNYSLSSLDKKSRKKVMRLNNLNKVH